MSRVSATPMVVATMVMIAVLDVFTCARSGGAEWLFSVRDNGLGIEPKYFERISALGRGSTFRFALAGSARSS